jgi:hypothetical protein
MEDKRRLASPSSMVGPCTRLATRPKESNPRSTSLTRVAYNSFRSFSVDSVEPMGWNCGCSSFLTFHKVAPIEERSLIIGTSAEKQLT